MIYRGNSRSDNRTVTNATRRAYFQILQISIFCGFVNDYQRERNAGKRVREFVKGIKRIYYVHKAFIYT